MFMLLIDFRERKTLTSGVIHIGTDHFITRQFSHNISRYCWNRNDTFICHKSWRIFLVGLKKEFGEQLWLFIVVNVTYIDQLQPICQTCCRQWLIYKNNF